jgi:hypothetical protein
LHTKKEKKKKGEKKKKKRQKITKGLEEEKQLLQNRQLHLHNLQFKNKHNQQPQPL